MKAVVVYESLWGNTAAIAKAIAEGLGEDAVAVSTADATPEVLEGAQLVVAGAPILGFSLPTQQTRDSAATGVGAPPADTSHPAMSTWLASKPAKGVRAATFETRIWWSPGSAAKAIMKELEAAGCTKADEPAKFIVTGRYGPLKDGELDRAWAWGATLAGS